MCGEQRQELIFRQLFDRETSTYTYLLADPNTMEGVLIDSVKEQVERDVKLADELGIKLLYLLETHVHADHVTGAGEIRKRKKAKIVYGVAAKVSCADVEVKDGDKLTFGGIFIQVIATPGHTDGCSSYLIEDKVFTGDTLLIRGCGRTDFQQGSSANLWTSVKDKLFRLPETTAVYPAHDYKGVTATSIAEEKGFNPRLGEGKTEEEFRSIMESLNLPKPKRIDIAVPANMKCGLD